MSHQGDLLFRAEMSYRAQGTGLLVRTTLSNFYVELSYGFLKVRSPQGTSPASGSFDVVIGTQPFDLWKRRCLSSGGSSLRHAAHTPPAPPASTGRSPISASFPAIGSRCAHTPG